MSQGVKEKSKDQWLETKVTLQTVMNENDDYGKILIKHLEKQNINLQNLLKDDSLNECNQSTGHCVVMVANGERSFMTYLGCVGNFQASHINTQQLIENDSPMHHKHIHVAGYYNIPGFWNGMLKQQLSTIKNKRNDHCNHIGDNSSTTISIVPQHDATGQWDGQLLDLLYLVDFLILNSLEALRICKLEGSVDLLNDINIDSNFTWDFMASFFQSASSTTYVVVTLGKRGVVVLYQGKFLCTVQPPIVYDNPVDPTGAGDAFIAGFLFGLINNWKKEDPRNAPIFSENSQICDQRHRSWNDSIKYGAVWGCVTGSACVMTKGASNPSTKEQIMELYNTSSKSIQK